MGGRWGRLLRGLRGPSPAERRRPGLGCAVRLPEPWAPVRSVRLGFNPSLFQVLTSPRAEEPGTGWGQSLKSGKSVLLVLGLVRSQVVTAEQ